MEVTLVNFKKSKKLFKNKNKKLIVCFLVFLVKIHRVHRSNWKRQEATLEMAMDTVSNVAGIHKVGERDSGAWRWIECMLG